MFYKDLKVNVYIEITKLSSIQIANQILVKLDNYKILLKLNCFFMEQYKFHSKYCKVLKILKANVLKLSNFPFDIKITLS